MKTVIQKGKNPNKLNIILVGTRKPVSRRSSHLFLFLGLSVTQTGQLNKLLVIEHNFKCSFPFIT